MSFSTRDVWQRIASEGIASVNECQEWAQRATESNEGRKFASGEKLLKALIGMGVLTAYQARVIAGTTQGCLSKDSWVLRGPVAHPLGKDWWLIHENASLRAAVGKEYPGTMRWGRWLTQNELTDSHISIQNLPESKAYGDLRSQGLGVINFSELDDGSYFFQMFTIVDPTILEQMQQVIPNSSQIWNIILQTTRQLAQLHARKIVHGRLAPDRVLWDGQERVSLLFDPCSSLIQAGQASRHGLLDPQLSEKQLAVFTAPEHKELNSGPTIASDIYSLGAIWRWLLYVQKRKDTAPGEILVPPLEKVLRRCLLPDPSARFSNAGQILQEMESVGQPQTTPSIGTIGKGTSGARGLSGDEIRSRREKRQSQRRVITLATWSLPAVAVLAALLLGWFGLRNQFTSSSREDSSKASRSEMQQPAEETEIAPSTSPLSERFQIVQSQNVNWVPPLISQTVSLERLPPGAQLYLVLRPRQMFEKEQWKSGLAVLQQDSRWNSIIELWVETLGLPLETVERVTFAFYGSISESIDRSLMPSLLPEVAVRVELREALSQDELFSRWEVEPDQSSQTSRLVTSKEGRAFYIPLDEDTLSNDEAADLGKNEDMVRTFTAGSTELMNELAELSGEEAPLLPAMQRLLDRSHDELDFCLLASPRYLLREQRASQQWLPEPLQQFFESALGRDSRSVMIQSHLDSAWYWEFQVIPEVESESVRISQDLMKQSADFSNRLEQWLGGRQPDSYWLAVAERLPQMFRFLTEYSRFGVEDGIVIANGYMPAPAASNLLVASWMLLKDPMLLQGDIPMQMEAGEPPETRAEFSVDQFLARTIRVFFEQESLEASLQLLEDAANEGSEYRVRFDLDSDAFQKAGITRNQQVRDFGIDNQKLRDALTELVRRANPVSNVSDLRLAEQQLVWLMAPDPLKPGNQMVLLTTKVACEEQGLELPEEFTNSSD